MQTQRVIYFGILIILYCTVTTIVGAEKTDRAIPLDEFIHIATKNDTVFEEILMDELRLRYKKDLVIPARDIILSVKHQYDFILNQDRVQPENAIALSKLFPYTGTTFSASYSSQPSFTKKINSSQLSFTVSQSIGRNAFGKNTRLLSTIVGIEIDVARHQIVEAYEDYLATIITEYINWYETFQKVDIAQSSYNENVKLLDNVQEREKNKIAYAVDVNKIKIQVYEKEENLIDVKEAYQRQLTTIKTILRYDDEETPVPVNSDSFFSPELSFEDDFKEFKERSRTYEILNLLKDKSSLEVAKDADDLLPSINLLIGLDMEGKRESLYEPDNMLFMGVSMEWPFPNQVERAEHETSKILLEKTRISNTNIHFRLYRDIKHLRLNLKQQQQLSDIAQKKNVLAKAVLEDETENYLYGKVTLNDFIRAVNVYDNNRLNIVTRHSQIKRLMVERLRILDLLITRKQINERHAIDIRDKKR